MVDGRNTKDFLCRCRSHCPYLDSACQTPEAAVCRNQNSMQVEETVSDDDLTWIKQMGVNYLNVQTGTGRATLENFVAIKKASRGRRVEGLEHIQQRQPQHRGDHA